MRSTIAARSIAAGAAGASGRAAPVDGGPGAALAEAEVIAHCRERMAHFKVPKRVVFVDTLPKNPSGKLLKRELRATLAT